jgi:hypothetical protein
VRSDYGPGVLGALYDTPLRPLILISDEATPRWLIVDRFAAICREARDIGYLYQRSGPLPAIEIYNEPDLDSYWSTRAAEMADVVWECYQVARQFSRGITVVSPGVSNLNQRGLAYLEKMIGAGVPDDVVVGFHRYPPGDDPTAIACRQTEALVHRDGMDFRPEEEAARIPAVLSREEYLAQ